MCTVLHSLILFSLNNFLSSGLIPSFWEKTVFLRNNLLRMNSELQQTLPTTRTINQSHPNSFLELDKDAVVEDTTAQLNYFTSSQRGCNSKRIMPLSTLSNQTPSCSNLCSHLVSGPIYIFLKISFNFLHTCSRGPKTKMSFQILNANMCNVCEQDGNKQKLFHLSTFCMTEVLRVVVPAAAIWEGAAFTVFRPWPVHCFVSSFSCLEANKQQMSCVDSSSVPSGESSEEAV